MTLRQEIMAYLIHLLLIGSFVASVRLVVGIHADGYRRRKDRRAAIRKRKEGENARPALNEDGK